jgi:deoxyribodipyrimidine photo-lyase
MKQEISICWIRRDLRIHDNAALYYALKSEYPVVILFIFDKYILDKLSDRADARVTFIYRSLQKVNEELLPLGASLLVKYGTPEEAWKAVLEDYQVKEVYTNRDYEPYAQRRDDALGEFLGSENISFKTFKDQVIFEEKEIIKKDGTPFTVFTPYFRRWQENLNDFYLKPYPVEKYIKNLLPTGSLVFPSYSTIGFEESTVVIPPIDYELKLASYELRRDYPADDATSRIGVHLRFGTVSIREAASIAIANKADKWLSELAWREFYMMILWHFPQTANHAFKPAYDKIKWRNNELEFKAWCNGTTGYPIVDAGMKQLNQIGYMHNRIRMVVGSFLCKHLLIDWKWGEAYFAEKLLDYELASNVGGWQWVCGSGNDAAPYFRVFNPALQTEKFDPDHTYINRWAPEYKEEKHPQPIVEHAFARNRALAAYKEALTE